MMLISACHNYDWQEKESSSFNRQDGQTSGASQCNPTDNIDSQVLHDHFTMVPSRDTFFSNFW